MNAEKIKLLKHALGLDSAKTPYRNYYSVNIEVIPEIVKELERDGFLKEYQKTVMYVYYRVTPQGLKAVGIIE